MFLWYFFRCNWQIKEHKLSRNPMEIARARRTDRGAHGQGRARTGAQVWQTPTDMGISSHFDEQTAKWDRMMRSSSNSTSVIYQFKKIASLGVSLHMRANTPQEPRNSIEPAHFGICWDSPPVIRCGNRKSPKQTDVSRENRRYMPWPASNASELFWVLYSHRTQLPADLWVDTMAMRFTR